MATIRQKQTGNWEVTVRSTKLSKPLYATFDTKEEAERFVRDVEGKLNRGEPMPIIGDNRPVLLRHWMDRYRTETKLSEHDSYLIGRLIHLIGDERVTVLNLEWCMAWVIRMKQERLAPGSIRKRVGAFARCIDWCELIGLCTDNPVRKLPKRYSLYNDNSVTDTERERRLLPGEEERIREVLKGRGEWLLLFDLALETAMRMREMYTLSTDQCDVSKKTIFLDRSKNGDRRQVPMSSVVVGLLSPIISRPGLLFPTLYDAAKPLSLNSALLSQQWARIAKQAGCDDLHFHDLRHEATCRLYERTTLSDLQISLITGHRDLSVLRRYANLRGSDLAMRLW